MKNSTFLFLFFLSFTIFGQNIQISTISKAQGGEYKFNENNLSCVPPALRREIDSIVGSAVKKFRQVNGERPKTTSFAWPVQKAVNTPYFEIWAISNFVDHNSNYPNQVTDYNCGSRSYDTSDGYNHQGVDIFTWPFSWDQFYNNQAEVIAAAPGMITFKQDGNFDQSCSFNNGDWNAVYIQHSDGSIALYGHMKAGTLTSKSVGDFVQVGEFLGVIGSSGNSTGPHLHFEVFDAAANLVDPYAGSCNNLNASSWWSNQKNYREPNINAILSQSAPPVFNPCPQPATVNAQTGFQFGETVYVATYFRDQIAGTQADFVLKNPNGDVINSWSKVFQNTYNSSYWWYNFSFQGPENSTFDFTFEVTYGGETKSTVFQVGNLGTATFANSNIRVYPNPFQKEINLSGELPISKVSIYDVNGKMVLQKKIGALKATLQPDKVPAGVYFLKIFDENGKKEVKKIVKF